MNRDCICACGKKRKKVKNYWDGLLDGHVDLGAQLVTSFAFDSQVSADIKFNTLN